MINTVVRVFVEKKSGYDIEAQHLYEDIKSNLCIDNLERVRILNCYDAAHLSKIEFNSAVKTVFSEKTIDIVYDEFPLLNENETAFATEYIPGQYDQRADSAIECIQLITKKRPLIQSSKVFILKGNLSEMDIKKIKSYCINPVDTREASLYKPLNLEQNYDFPKEVESLHGFLDLDVASLEELHKGMKLAMSLEDLKKCHNYFKLEEKRNPTITEIKVLDTYWSDHCRHTTFLTEIKNVKIEEGPYSDAINDAFNEYIVSHDKVYGENENGKAITLMDIALIAMKELKKNKLIDNLDESDEINACSIRVPVVIDNKEEDWLVMFKNETHNHPTEIEPFGGAATCLGGAIRDPLSGRSYVYQAMRVTGSGDPRKKIEDTIPGKLSQRKITTEAAHGYSSYGNQIGLCTGMVTEIYDEGYIAKRMEIGAVIGAAPAVNVIRKEPVPGDKIILLGGKTGRDGCGGATGSSKKHTEKSISVCGAEVQKGNAPTERKIQRLFRKKEVSQLIKRCNDFGAGGVAVAIGELAEGLKINLDNVSKKYEGLDGTELAISESQERMAVVVNCSDVDEFIRLSEEENLEATVVAEVENSKRLVMTWRDKTIVNISRDFLNTNGAKSYTDVIVESPKKLEEFFKPQNDIVNIEKKWIDTIADINVCSQKGLGERFDSTIGTGSVLMPFGGKYQLTPTEAMVCKLPIMNGETKTATIMTFGFNPSISKLSPFHGAVYSIIDAVSRAVAVGAKYENIKLTLQEYFERLGNDPARWGKPFAALLGAFFAQKSLGIAAIGGKDSMSGSFNDMDVPPTLVTFAVDVIQDCSYIVSQEFKAEGNKVILLSSEIKEDMLPNFDSLKTTFKRVNALIFSGKIKACHSVRGGGICETITKMCFGNKIGFKFKDCMKNEDLFMPRYGSFIIEVEKDFNELEELINLEYKVLGTTEGNNIIINNINLSLEHLIVSWMKPLETVFSVANNEKVEYYPEKLFRTSEDRSININIGGRRPKIFIPVFPGTNCEYDSSRAFEAAGGKVSTMIFKNLTAQHIEESVQIMAKEIKDSQIIMFPGGFSAGDEPDGSGKFIANAFRNPILLEAVMDLLNNRDGLILGICNGFQALIKLGLLPFGEIREIDANCPTLTYNSIGRHVSCMVNTKVVSNLSPWLNSTEVGDIYTVPISHGEGRFVGNDDVIKSLFDKGQVATQYVNMEGKAVSYMPFNPNGSTWAIEGITSPNGRVLGKMAHSERVGTGLYKNIFGDFDQKLFKSGVNYFR